MNLDEFDVAINDLVSRAIWVDNLKSIHVISVLESAKMSIAIMIHENARKEGMI